MPERTPKDGDIKKVKAVYSFIDQLHKNNSDIEITIWCSAFLSFIGGAFVVNGYTYEQMSEELEDFKTHSKRWWDDKKKNFINDSFISKRTHTQQWIKTAERLPDIGKDVLTIYHNCDACVAYRVIPSGSNHKEWISTYERKGLFHDPTHWMPFPDLPELKNE